MFEDNNITIRNSGNKGKNLREMTLLNIPVPSGFVITDEVTDFFLKNDKFPEGFIENLQKFLQQLEEKTKKKINDIHNPLFVSVRSSGHISMPGMLESILNVGVNRNIRNNCRKYSEDFLREIFNENPFNYIDDVSEQILLSIKNIIVSLNKDRVKEYKNFSDINKLSMGIIIQEMVFGNLNENSYTGIVFSSHPGSRNIFGEFLTKHQGSKIVNGSITGEDIQKLPIHLLKELEVISKKLENYFKFIQDIEFTVEDNKLYILQTRNCKLSDDDIVLMAERFLQDNIINEKEFFQIIPDTILNNINTQKVVYKNDTQILSTGISILQGALTGRIVLRASSLDFYIKNNEKTILFIEETHPDHISSVLLANGIVTKHGGATCHLGIIVRGLGKVSLLSLKNLEIFSNYIKINDTILQEGDFITIDGHNSNLLRGENEIEIIEKNYHFLKKPCNKIKVRTNGDQVEDIINAKNFIYHGIGLCRTEHMLIRNKDMLNAFRALILNKDMHQVEVVKNLYKEEIVAMLKINNHHPFKLRLLDPPLHEFIEIKELEEVNPMLGNRGIRLGITNDYIYKLQIEAIFDSIIEMNINSVEIEMPFVFHSNEIFHIKNIINNIYEEKYKSFNLIYKIGVMIEIPRITYVLQEFIEHVDFVSFGTNDLTQMMLGISRDDYDTFIPKYMDNKIIENDPFQIIDDVVFNLIKSTIEKIRIIKPNITIGICGEHAGYEESVKKFSTLPIDYLSVSPFKIISTNFLLNKYS